ncbi:serine/Arginine-related protein 53-like isoform X5 [Nilaparvata lugens]|uniref:serine/Arginine-related protein 53-like isoform X5 n=1 Tax=Nilaparvata lugens TaxID=108931 RepID=UPI00193D6BAE|nr:serine/Arginine-related protein 53-like isoform X5 [Nilaparvata lugens]
MGGGRYSSDSDSYSSSSRRKKHSSRAKERSRSSSSSSSNSPYSKKSKNSQKVHRLKSKDDYKSKSKSVGSDRGRSSSSQERKRYGSSKSRRSRSKSKEKSTKANRNRSSPSDSEDGRLNDTMKKAIKAAKTAGKKLQQQGLLFDISLGDPSKHEKAIEEICTPSFKPKSFSSSAKNKSSDNAPVIVDVAIPSGKALPAWNHKPENLLHPSIASESKEDRLNRWVKRLMQARQRSLNGDFIDYM